MTALPDGVLINPKAKRCHGDSARQRQKPPGETMNTRHVLSLVVACLVLCSVVLVGSCAVAADPVLVTHRGLAQHAPENTLPAFAACSELGIGIELDIRTTKDGQLVVLHDDKLGRTSDGPDRSLREFTLTELQRFDAGRWFHPRFAGVRVPTLEEALVLVKERKRGPTILALNVKDISQDSERQLVELVKKYALLNESFAFDQTDESSRRLKALNPKFRIGANVNRQTVEPRLKEGLLDVFLVTFVPTAEEVRRLHERGKQVVFNFVGSTERHRDPKTWTQARESGIDGLFNDFALECLQHWRHEDSAEAAEAAPQPKPPLLETLLAQERQFYEAWKKRDFDTVEKMLPEDYVEVNSFFGRMNKTQVLQDLCPHLLVSHYALEDARVIQPTQDTALLTYRLTFAGKFKEQDSSGKSLSASLYVYRKKQWVLVFAQMTAL